MDVLLLDFILQAQNAVPTLTGFATLVFMSLLIQLPTKLKLELRLGTTFLGNFVSHQDESARGGLRRFTIVSISSKQPE
ncbi:uncharacterized protein PHALS_08918 [Plasmopara halstedii]|uniref:Uncharacterized protein n=1 Tax=Plasmopara halstedii TaxID=4781 RepID=A0A0P1ADT5_PLAHL|nr:uncharacterized protein PHALS_08918 [Plasmopara halstedii]CEG38871.1 hypothetical protein PHALS_08918 [Plasmopara halstedii]|eukprot:XP_024575240.1 hypothetical protein PHALS_08918 [Plasmopara halstedii]